MSTPGVYAQLVRDLGFDPLAAGTEQAPAVLAPAPADRPRRPGQRSQPVRRSRRRR